MCPRPCRCVGAVDQPSDQACRDPAGPLCRQGCRHACGCATTGPSNSDSGKDGGRPALAVHRQNCGHACDQADQPGDQACQDSADSIYRRPCGDATTGPSVSDCAEEGVSPAGAVHRQSAHACDQADQPGDQACQDCADSIYRRPCGDATTGPSVSDCAEDGVSPAGAVYRQSGHACDQADQPGDQACQDCADSMYRRPCGDATTGPSVSGCAADGVSPAGAVHRQSCGGGSTTKQQAVFDPESGLRYAHTGCMDCYMNRSFEELRWEDYQDGRWQATSTLRRGRRWPSGPAFMAETPSASPHVPARDEPAENTDPVHRQSDGQSAFAGTTDSVHPKSVEHSTSVRATKPVLQLCEPLSSLAGDSVHRRSDGHSTFVGATVPIHPQGDGHSTFVGATNPAHRQSDKHYASSCSTSARHRQSDGHSTFAGATISALRQSDKHFEFPGVTDVQCDDFASRKAKSGAHSADDPELPVIIWIERVTGSLKGDRSFGKWLHDGTVLCELVNKIQPGTVNWINYSKNTAQAEGEHYPLQGSRTRHRRPKRDHFQRARSVRGP